MVMAYRVEKRVRSFNNVERNIVYLQKKGF